MKNTTRIFTLFAPMALLALLGACSGESSGESIAVTGTNTACELDTNTVVAGTVKVKFTNKADQISEIYLLDSEHGVVSEVENVPTGATRTLNATVGAGSYTVLCKPGQEGDGFGETLTVTGKAAAAAKPTKTIEMTTTEHRFEFIGNPVEGATFEAGEVVRFELSNEGAERHEFEVLLPNGEPLGEIGPTESGKEGAVTMTFTEKGTYTFLCDIEDHKAMGMVGTFEVA